MTKKRFLKVYIEITNICNLKCSFCPIDNRKKEYMDVEKFEYILSQVKDYTDLIALHVKGEPLMHPKLEEILRVCEKYDMKVNITTNATRLDSVKDILINSKAVRQLNLSLHSIHENEYYMEEESDYLSKTIEAVNEILDKSQIIISYRLWNLRNINENKDNEDILLALEKAYNIENLVEVAKKNEFIEFRKNCFLNQDTEFSWPNENDPIISEVGTCQGLKTHIAILVNGDVVPCCLDQNGEIKLGNIMDDKLEDILNNDLSKNILKGFNDNKIVADLCKRCSYRLKFN